MSDLSAIRAKVYAATTGQHVPLLTRMEARTLFGRIEALEAQVARQQWPAQPYRRIDRLHRWLRETRRQLDDACLLLDEEDLKGASPYVGLSPSSAATQHHPLKEVPDELK